MPDRRSTFRSLLLSVDPRRMVLADRAHPSRPLYVDGQEVMADGYWMVWFLYNGSPWDIARFYRTDGTFTGYYADVLEPVMWSGSDAATLQPIVDLFLDLWITPEGEVQVLDEDEFGAAVRDGVVTPQQQGHAERVLQDLLRAVAEGSFPPHDVRTFKP